MKKARTPARRTLSMQSSSIAMISMEKCLFCSGPAIGHVDIGLLLASVAYLALRHCTHFPYHSQREND